LQYKEKSVEGSSSALFNDIREDIRIENTLRRVRLRLRVR
jgi:hypothetical protein